MKKIKGFLVLGAVIILTPLVYAGSEAGNGEDGAEANFFRKNKQIRAHTIDGIKAAVMRTLNMVSLRELEAVGGVPINGNDPKLAAIVKSMLDRGLINDIFKSEYSFREDKSCLENGKPVQASSALGDLGGEICFSIPMLIESDSVYAASLVRTAFHEHAHHLGFSNNQAYEISDYIYVKAKKFYKDDDILTDGKTERIVGEPLELPYGLKYPVQIRVVTSAAEASLFAKMNSATESTLLVSEYTCDGEQSQSTVGVINPSQPDSQKLSLWLKGCYGKNKRTSSDVHVEFLQNGLLFKSLEFKDLPIYTKYMRFVFTWEN